MAYRLPSGSSRHTSAVILNLKESQFLDKTMQTLNLEKAYLARLKDLDIKLVNFYYSRLKQTVGRIHSHLRAEDVKALTQLENEGKLKTNRKNVLASNSYGKIKAARRRLGLDVNQRRVISVLPIIRVPNDSKQIEDQRQNCHLDVVKSLSCSHNMQRHTNSAGISIKEKLNVESIIKESVAEEKGSTPSPTLKRRQSIAPMMLYSSHDPKALNANSAELSVPDSFGPNPYEVRRLNFMAAESQVFNKLIDRKEEFVDEVEAFVIENPSITEYHPPGVSGALINALGNMLASKRKVRSLQSQMDEMRKSRYLRIDDELIDNSQHITNAKQMVDKTKEWRNFQSKGKSVNASVTL